MIKINQQKTQDSLLLELTGHLNEDFVQSEVTVPDAPKYVFDLKNLESINSCGIREFLHLLRRLPPSAEVEYVNCSPLVIYQFNMVDGFIGKGRRIKSFFVPYVCDDTQEEVLKLYDTGNLDAAKIPLEIQENGKTFEFDGSAPKYFKFLSYQS